MSTPEQSPTDSAGHRLREELKALRLACGLSMEEFGELVGLHRSYICHLEKGRQEWDTALVNGLEARAREAGARKKQAMGNAGTNRERKRVRFLELRKSLGLTQVEFAEIMGVGGPTVCAHEKDVHEWEDIPDALVVQTFKRWLTRKHEERMEALEAWKA